MNPSITEALTRNDPEELLHIPISLSLEPPEDDYPGYAESICRQLARHPHATVRGNAMLGFGHLARTVGIIWKPNDVRALLKDGLVDPDPYVRGQSAAAASDLRHFLKWSIRAPRAVD